MEKNKTFSELDLRFLKKGDCSINVKALGWEIIRSGWS